VTGVPATTPTTAPGPLSAQYAAVTVSMLVLVTIVAFESLAVSTAMPTVAADLHAVRSYGLAFSVMLTAQLLGIVLAGVWADRSGPLPGAFAGQVLFGLGAAICGSSNRLDVFLTGRVLTGLGGGLLVVMLYVIAGRVFPEEARPRLFSLISAAWVLPSLIGPPLAAWLTHVWTWRLVFWVVVAPVVVTLATMHHLRGRIRASHFNGTASTRDHRTHVRVAWAGLGIALAAGAVQLGTYDLVIAWSPRTVLGILGLLGVGLTAPMLVPRGTWRMARGLPSAMLARALFSASFAAAVSYVPLMLVNERGTTLGFAGLIIAVGSLGWAAGAWVQGLPRFAGRRPALVYVGASFLVLGMALLALNAWFGWPSGLAAPAFVLSGLAMGLGVTSTTVLVLALSPVEEHGEHSSSIQLADVLGGVMGVAVATALFAALHDPAGTDRGVYTLIFGLLSASAVVAVPAGRRIRT
jgi:MFS family permease